MKWDRFLIHNMSQFLFEPRISNGFFKTIIIFKIWYQWQCLNFKFYAVLPPNSDDHRIYITGCMISGKTSATNELQHIAVNYNILSIFILVFCIGKDSIMAKPYIPQKSLLSMNLFKTIWCNLDMIIYSTLS